MILKLKHRKVSGDPVVRTHTVTVWPGTSLVEEPGSHKLHGQNNTTTSKQTSVGEDVSKPGLCPLTGL